MKDSGGRENFLPRCWEESGCFCSLAEAAQQYSAISDAATARGLVLYEVLRPPWKNSIRVQSQSNSQQNWSQHTSKPLFESLLLPRQLKPGKKNALWGKDVTIPRPLLTCPNTVHLQKLIVPQCCTCTASLSELMVILAGAGEEQWQTEANVFSKLKQKIRSMCSSSRAPCICNNIILLWGGLVYFFAFKRDNKGWWTE